jgi:selenocysteine lyase/cysteine desulfurase
VSTIAYDVEAVRARFSSLRSGLAFFDGPGGTQVPDSVIEAVSTYFRESNANVGGPYGTSIRTEALIEQAHETAARFLGCDDKTIMFGANMTTLSFALTRTVARSSAPETRSSSPDSTTTRTSPLARARARSRPHRALRRTE